MKEAFDLIKERLEEKKSKARSDLTMFLNKGRGKYALACETAMGAFTDALSIVSEVESEYAVHTNADYIRSLSDGELAHFLLDFKNNFDGSVYDWLREEK